LSHPDFINTIAAAAPGSLQRRPRWWLNPSFVPALMKVNDSSGKPILQTALDQSGETLFSLFGFPVELSSGCPGTDGTAQKVAAFGSGSAYSLMVRQQFELVTSK